MDEQDDTSLGQISENHFYIMQLTQYGPGKRFKGRHTLPEAQTSYFWPSDLIAQRP